MDPVATLQDDRVKDDYFMMTLSKKLYDFHISGEPVDRI